MVGVLFMAAICDGNMGGPAGFGGGGGVGNPLMEPE